MLIFLEGIFAVEFFLDIFRSRNFFSRNFLLQIFLLWKLFALRFSSQTGKNFYEKFWLWNYFLRNFFWARKISLLLIFLKFPVLSALDISFRSLKVSSSWSLNLKRKMDSMSEGLFFQLNKNNFILQAEFSASIFCLFIFLQYEFQQVLFLGFSKKKKKHGVIRLINETNPSGISRVVKNEWRIYPEKYI